MCRTGKGSRLNKRLRACVNQQTLTWTVVPTWTIFMCSNSISLTLIEAHMISLALLCAVDKSETYFVLAAYILIEKFLHAWFTVDGLVLAWAAIVAIVMARTLNN